MAQGLLCPTWARSQDRWPVGGEPMVTGPASWELPLSGVRPPWGYLDSEDIDSLLDRLDEVLGHHPPVDDSAHEPAPSNRPGRPRVLLIDHESESCERASRRLAQAGYEVNTAPDGRAALAALREESADFV